MRPESALTNDLKAAGVTLMLAGLKKPVREAIDRVGLDAVIGVDNIFISKGIAIHTLDARFASPEKKSVA